MDLLALHRVYHEAPKARREPVSSVTGVHSTIDAWMAKMQARQGAENGR